MSGKILGIGGIFFKSNDPPALRNWYKQWLDMPVDDDGYTILQTSELPAGAPQVWSAFKADTEYFQPSDQPFMINFMVDDLEAALARVQQGGAQLAGEPSSDEYGKFGWFIDPDGNKVELWQPPDTMPG